ncbi:MAG TPA: curli-like amyloid fiber formation chaperone CsgH [Geobacteraceae bacterium]|jgi:hypothetical protein|nr:curli-like amyloid fiber formation chaperone CsgH [Geobacteraceae bacterium]
MKSIVICLLVCGGLLYAGTATGGEELNAWFDTRQTGDFLVVTAYCRIEKEGKVRYRMETSKQGPSGTSKSVQSGAAVVVPGEPTELSRLSLGIRPGDRYTILLTLFEDGTLVAEEILVHPPHQ